MTEVAVNEPEVAVMVVTPSFRAVTVPLLSTLATVGSDDVQPTDCDTLELVRSERDWVAVKLRVCPMAIVAEAGARPRPVMVATDDLALIFALPVLLLMDAVMVAEP